MSTVQSDQETDESRYLGQVAWEHFEIPLTANADKYHVVMEYSDARGRTYTLSNWFDLENKAREFVERKQKLGHRVLAFEWYTRRDLVPMGART